MSDIGILCYWICISLIKLWKNNALTTFMQSTVMKLLSLCKYLHFSLPASVKENDATWAISHIHFLHSFSFLQLFNANQMGTLHTPFILFYLDIVCEG